MKMKVDMFLRNVGFSPYYSAIMQKTEFFNAVIVFCGPLPCNVSHSTGWVCKLHNNEINLLGCRKRAEALKWGANKRE
jgi:hypothetical protein